jgi:hypothetical protein
MDVDLYHSGVTGIHIHGCQGCPDGPPIATKGMKLHETPGGRQGCGRELRAGLRAGTAGGNCGRELRAGTAGGAISC